MRKMLWTTTALALCAAPAAAQQMEKSPFAADAVVAPALPAAVAPAALQEAPAPSLHVSARQMDAEVRAQEAARGDRERAVMNRAWWYTVAAVAVGVAVALIVFN